MKAKVEEMEGKTREGRTRRIIKEVVGFVQYVVGKNNFQCYFNMGRI